MLFGPSAAGGAYIPAFCDIVIMRDGNASMYLGSPRMAEMVIGEKVTLEEMGGARMHTGVSGCGHMLVKTDAEGIDARAALPRLLPDELGAAAAAVAAPLAPGVATPLAEIVPEDENKPFDMRLLIDTLVDEDSLLRDPRALGEGADRRLRAARRPRRSGSSPTSRKQKGGVLFVDSADKAARFIWTCNAFNIPLLFLADVPGLHDRHAGRAPGDHPPRREDDQRRQLEATVPKLCVIVRKAYGAGPLRDGRAGVRARRDDRAAVRRRSR